MCDLGFLEMDEIDLREWVGISLVIFDAPWIQAPETGNDHFRAAEFEGGTNSIYTTTFLTIILFAVPFAKEKLLQPAVIFKIMVRFT